MEESKMEKNTTIKEFKEEYERIALTRPKNVNEADNILSDLFNLIANKNMELQYRIEKLEK